MNKEIVWKEKEYLAVSPSLKEFKIFLLCFIIFFFTFLSISLTWNLIKVGVFSWKRNRYFAIKASECWGVYVGLCVVFVCPEKHKDRTCRKYSDGKKKFLQSESSPLLPWKDKIKGSFLPWTRHPEPNIKEQRAIFHQNSALQSWLSHLLCCVFVCSSTHRICPLNLYCHFIWRTFSA